MDYVMSAEPGRFAVAMADGAGLSGSPPPGEPRELPWKDATKGLVAASLIMSWRSEEYFRGPGSHCTLEALNGRFARFAETVDRMAGATEVPGVIPPEIARLHTLAVAARDAKTPDEMFDHFRGMKAAIAEAKRVVDAR